ncbi:MAG: HAD family hydrolase [Fimbriimonadales bacterium]
MDKTVILLDVDNTLLDNDSIVADLRHHLEQVEGPRSVERYFQEFEEIREEMGYADYLGALQRYRSEDPYDADFMKVSYFLLNYPFESRLYPGALEAVSRLASLGTTVILTDGDVVFQPWKIARSGLFDAVDGRVMIQIHKERELFCVEQRFPAERYVLVDDKLRILAACKEIWGDKLTTVFPRQGHYAFDPKVLSAYPPADLTVEKIAELIAVEPDLITGG